MDDLKCSMNTCLTMNMVIEVETVIRGSSSATLGTVILGGLLRNFIHLLYCLCQTVWFPPVRIKVMMLSHVTNLSMNICTLTS